MMGRVKDLMIELYPIAEEEDDFQVWPQAEEIWYPQPFSENELIPFLQTNGRVSIPPQKRKGGVDGVDF